MKKIFFILFTFFIAFGAYCQVPTRYVLPYDSVIVTKPNGAGYLKASKGNFADSLWHRIAISIGDSSKLAATTEWVKRQGYGSGGSGNTNSNVGSGYRWAIPGTNDIKTLLEGYGVSIDSVTSNSLKTTIDSATLSNYYLRRKDSSVSGGYYPFSTNPKNYLTTAVTSVGVSMPSAFTVTNSPITTTGTIAITGAGTTGQYIRGDGTLAAFPTITSGTVISVATDNNSGITGGTFTTSGTISADTVNVLSTKYNVNHKADSVITVVTPKYLGQIWNLYNAVSTAPLNTSGTATVSVSGGNYIGGGGSGVFTNTINFPDTVTKDYWRQYIRFSVSSITGSTFGFGAGIRSTNGTTAVNAIIRIDLTSGAGKGKLIINAGSANTQVAISGTGVSFSISDSLVFIVERRRDSLIGSLYNKTTNSATITLNYQYITTSSGTAMPNTGTFSIFELGGSQIIDSINIGSQSINYCNTAVIADSKGQYLPNSYASRFAAQLNNFYPNTITLAGGFDRTAEVLTRITEIINLHPKQIVLCIGSNDIRTGVSTGTWQANYASIVSQLIAAGIAVYHIVPPETSINVTPIETFVEANYPNNVIPVYYAMQYPSVAANLNADGVHPNQTGNDLIFSTILNSEKLNGGATYTYAGNSIIAGGTTIISGTDKRVLFDDNGLLGEDAGFIYDKTTDFLDVGKVAISNTSDHTAFLIASDANRTLSGATIHPIMRIFGSIQSQDDVQAIFDQSAAGGRAGILASVSSSGAWQNNVMSFAVTGSTYPTNTYFTNISGKTSDAGYHFVVSQGSELIALAIGTATSDPLYFGTNNSARWLINTSGDLLPNNNNSYDIGSSSLGIKNTYIAGNLSVGTTQSARLTLGAGTATASTSPLKFTTGTNLTVIENGSIEYDGTEYYASAGGTRQNIAKGRRGSFSQVGAATTVFTVTFGGTQPNATYNVQVTPTAVLSAALFYITNKTTTTFDVTFLAGLTGTVTFDYLLTN